jgi:hypothetical protein
MVPEAEFTSYYGRQIIKSPTWKNPEVPLYLFLGGAGGTSAVIGALGEFTGRPTLTRAAHFTAAGGALASVGLLIVDLGRPMRFLHMLRVFKPTSPLSVGSYILSPFSALTTATAGLRVLGWFPVLRKLAAVGSAVFGGPMTTYTAVLLSNTAVPSWHESHESMPFLFAGSAMAAGGGVTMALTPVDEAGPARTVALAGAAIELAAAQRVEHGRAEDGVVLPGQGGSDVRLRAQVRVLDGDGAPGGHRGADHGGAHTLDGIAALAGHHLRVAQPARAHAAQAERLRLLDEQEQRLLRPEPARGGVEHREHLVFERHVGAVRERLAAGRPDLCDDIMRRPAGLARAVQPGAQVVDHHPGASGREGQRVRPTQPPSGAGDDHHSALA